MKILMVCLGNICRSPMAEGILQTLVNQYHLTWQVESAGTNQFHTGEAPHPSSQKVCLENGIDISSQRARTFIHEDMLSYDRIYALDTQVLADIQRISGNAYNENKVSLLLDELYPGQHKSVTDPWYGGEDGYYPVFEEIKRCCEHILDQFVSIKAE